MDKIIKHSLEHSRKILELYIQNRYPECHCDKTNMWQCDKCYIQIVIDNLGHGLSRIAAAPETAKERGKLKEINADLLEACKKSRELLQEVAQMNIQPFPIMAVDLNNQLREAIAKTESE